MAEPLLKESSIRTPSSKSSRRSYFAKEKISASKFAAALQLEEEKRELIYSLMALGMKFGLLSIGVASLFNLGFASHQRIRRHIELSSIVQAESKKYKKLQVRFDHLFTIGGQSRFMEEQDQLIMPNSLRVIWR